MPALLLMDNELPKIKRGPHMIHRSVSDRMVFGVCGGIADHYNIESLWVRLVFIFLGITGAIGFLLYLALAFLMPPDPAKEKEQSADWGGRYQTERRRNLLGLGIVAIGVIAFYNELFPDFWLAWKMLWPIVTILIGFSLISDTKK